MFMLRKLSLLSKARTCKSQWCLRKEFSIVIQNNEQKLEKLLIELQVEERDKVLKRLNQTNPDEETAKNILEWFQNNGPLELEIWKQQKNQSDASKLDLEKEAAFKTLTEKSIMENMISANPLQDRFKSDSKFFWNKEMIKTFMECLNSNDKRIHLAGPQRIGKSHNFALFSLLLRLNPKKYRLLYLNNIEAWATYMNCEDESAFLLRELLFTMGSDMKNEIVQDMFRNILASNDKIRPLKQFFLETNIKPILLVDQINYLNSQKIATKQNLLNAQTIRAKYIEFLPYLMGKTLFISSFTDETINAKKSQEWNYHDLYYRFSKKESYLFLDQTVKDDKLKSEIFEHSNGIIGEMSAIISNKKYLDDLNSYIADRKGDVSDSIMIQYRYLIKMEKDNPTEIKRINKAYALIALAVDRNIPVIISDRSILDRRYLVYDKNNQTITSLWPIVQRAFREGFQTDEYIKFMLQFLYKESGSSFGRAFESLLFLQFEMTQVLFDLELENNNTKEIKKITSPLPFPIIIFHDWKSVQKLIVNELKKTLIVYRPKSQTFQDIDFLIVDFQKDKTIIYLFQAKAKLKDYSSWKEFITTENDSRKNIEKLFPPDKNFEIYYCLIYLEDNLSLETIKEDFKKKVWFCHAKSLPVFANFNPIRIKRQENKE